MDALCNSTGSPVDNSKRTPPESNQSVAAPIHPCSPLRAGNALATYTMVCAHCGASFIAWCHTSRYCGRTCRTAAYKARSRQPRTTSAIEVREWEGTAIQRRLIDGYVNATAMCKAGEKHLPHFMANNRTSQYMEALSGSVGIPTDLLKQTITTGPNEQRGTWVHPRLAVDLARWIAPAFAVWMDGWFLESAQPAEVPASQVTQAEALPPSPRLRTTPDAEITPEDAASVIGLACASIGEQLSRYAALLGSPPTFTVQVFNEAHIYLSDAKDLLSMVERMSAKVKVVSPQRF